MKKLWVLLLAALLLCCAAAGAEIIESGTCGDSATWSVNDEGLLLIEGTGVVNSHPWSPEDVKRIEVRSGITSIDCLFAFSDCEKLTDVSFPDTLEKLDEYAFDACTALTGVDLPEGLKVLGDGAFRNCTALTSAPQLPATTLASNCYAGMFTGCTALTSAPTLPATTLATRCYSSMFDGCTSLSSITCLATNISASNCLQGWVKGVKSSGTFTKSSSMSSWPTGTNGIPQGWTVKNQ